jgi:hypothetical protein
MKGDKVQYRIDPIEVEEYDDPLVPIIHSYICRLSPATAFYILGYSQRMRYLEGWNTIDMRINDTPAEVCCLLIPAADSTGRALRRVGFSHRCASLNNRAGIPECSFTTR